MPEGSRVLRLGDMVLRRGGSLAQRFVQAVISVALRLFFRRIETSRAHLVPAAGALVFVLNHPNGIIDPALVFAALPRRISFLAKSTLFRIPVAGWLLRTVEALPLYRRVDAGTIRVEGALVDPTTINVTCTLGLRDKSDFDDSYSGFVAYAVVADTEA